MLMHEQTCVIPIFSLFSIDSTPENVQTSIQTNDIIDLTNLIVFVCVDGLRSSQQLFRHVRMIPYLTGMNQY